MIQMIRVDYRLLHGQVAVSWTSALGADCILLVSDTVLNDKLRLQALSLAKPEGCKVVVKNTEDAVKALQSGVTDKYKLFVVCETIQQAGAVAKAMGVKKINLGNVPLARMPPGLDEQCSLRPKTRHTSKSCSARAMNCSFR
mgnify:FL=1